MRQIFITLVIAVATGGFGYFLGANKTDQSGSHSDETLVKKESTNKRFSTETVFEINPFGARTAQDRSYEMMMRQFLQTQFAIIQSQETIRRAIDDYGLKERLDKNEQELIKEITSCMSLGQERGTDLIKLEVIADSELEAQQIAYALLHTYSKRREEALDMRRKESIQEFKDKRKLQEDRVEDHRTRLYALSKKLQIPYHGKEGRLYTGRNSDNDESKKADEIYQDAKRAYEQMRSFVNSLDGLNDEKFNGDYFRFW